MPRETGRNSRANNSRSTSGTNARRASGSRAQNVRLAGQNGHARQTNPRAINRRPTHATRRGASAQNKDYLQAQLWTKGGSTNQSRRQNAYGTRSNKKSKQSASSILATIFGLLLAAIKGIFSLLAKFFSLLGKGLVAVFQKSRIAGAAIIVVVLIGAFVLFDNVSTTGRAYGGVHVGRIDVSGMTQQEITQAVESAYSDQFNSQTVTIYASEDAKNRTAEAAAEKSNQEAAIAEQVAVEEAVANTDAWQATAGSLGGTINAADAARAAIAIGREDGGFFGRLSSQLFGSSVGISASLDANLVENFAAQIDATVGTPRVDYDVALNNGVAYVTSGSDGLMLNRETLSSQMADAFIGNSNETSFVANAEYAPVRITEAAASECANAITSAISGGVNLTYANNTLNIAAAEIGGWVQTSVVQTGQGYALQTGLDVAKATPAISADLMANSNNVIEGLTFSVNDGTPTVQTQGDINAPDMTDVANNVSNALFGAGLLQDIQNAQAKGSSAIDVQTTTLSSDLSFEDALTSGIIGEIATYTTEYTTTAGTENRNHNIELVSQLLNNSVATSGGTWSYNDTTGNCDESKGFLGAGAIVAGEYVDSVGGGICQVATTVFNAVYESGLPVAERHNHSLYISSYPQGRDAAVSYPELDFRWQNDTSNDVLLKVTTQSGSVTATLYGVDPNYTVETETGNWQEGATYSTTTKVDESLSPGYSYVKTRGSDGRSCTVTRTVKSSSGETVREDVFSSVYDPVDEVVVTGPTS